MSSRGAVVSEHAEWSDPNSSVEQAAHISLLPDIRLHRDRGRVPTTLALLI